MFAGWDNFYLIVGPSAGSLIGLMFVVETLTADTEPRRMEMGAAVYITPIVFHFAIVLVLSVLTQVPGLSALVVAACMAVLGLGGAIYGALTITRLHNLTKKQVYQPDFSDRFFYGYLPTLMYVALAGAGVALVSDQRAGTYTLGAVTMVILIVGIRNAWDLVTAIVKTLAAKRSGQTPNP